MWFSRLGGLGVALALISPVVRRDDCEFCASLGVARRSSLTIVETREVGTRLGRSVGTPGCAWLSQAFELVCSGSHAEAEMAHVPAAEFVTSSILNGSPCYETKRFRCRASLDRERRLEAPPGRPKSKLAHGHPSPVKVMNGQSSPGTQGRRSRCRRTRCRSRSRTARGCHRPSPGRPRSRSQDLR